MLLGAGGRGTKKFTAGQARKLTFLSTRWNHKSLPEYVTRHMTKEQLFPAVIATVKALSEPAPVKTVDKVISEEEIEQYLSEGWSFVSVVNTQHHVMVRKSLNGDFDQARCAGVGA